MFGIKYMEHGSAMELPEEPQGHSFEMQSFCSQICEAVRRCGVHDTGTKHQRIVLRVQDYMYVSAPEFSVANTRLQSSYAFHSTYVAILFRSLRQV